MKGDASPALRELIADLEALVRERLANWPSKWEGYHWPGYTYEHTMRVRNLALRLAREAGADERVVELAALLHDIEKPAGAEHAAAGAVEAARLLAERNVEPALAERVCHAIATHAGSNTPEHPLENRVLGDADLIDANFGLVATWRFITIRAGHQGAVEETVAAMPEWLPRKNELMGLLTSEVGLAVARERSARMHRFCADLARAMAGGDSEDGLTRMVAHINAHYERGSLGEQLPELRELARAARDPVALSACDRLEAEASGKA